MEKIIFEYNGFIFYEPNMLLSNWLITFICMFCIYRLSHLPPTSMVRFYRLVFIMNGIGAFLGGLAHLTFYYSGKPFQAFAWIFVGIGTYYLQRIAIIFARKPDWQDSLILFSGVKLALFIAALLYFQSFFVVLADLALGLFILVVPIHTGNYLATKNKGSMYMLFAIGILILSAIFPVFRISIHQFWFTFNDLGHVFLALSLFIIYLSTQYFANSPTALREQDIKSYRI